jgi:hypothetical protein
VWLEDATPDDGEFEYHFVHTYPNDPNWNIGAPVMVFAPEPAEVSVLAGIVLPTLMTRRRARGVLAQRVG